jgi:16S rRNA (uracil1498-N3)-methyltransferase
MIQKATELGVTKFIPVITERTVVRNINYERLIKIVTEASEQSNRLSIPEIDKLQRLDEFFKNNKNLNLIFGDLNSDNKKLKINNKKLLCILIGPEGDYTEVEREKILKYSGTQSIKLGNNILRTETAVISALSVINFIKN